MNKYNVLVNILDQLRKEAPKEFKRYYPNDSDLEKVNQARSKAFIHLFLKVRFGLISFKEREHFVTDGPDDGGIDAYYIDEEAKQVYFVQSKFRTNDKNFTNKEIAFSELLSMDVDRITEGETTSENGQEYNGKIKQLIRELSNLSDIGRFSYVVVILANIKEASTTKLKKLTGGFTCEKFDYARSYQELVLPIITGTYYDQDELVIQLNLDNNVNQGERIGYQVTTKHIECEISVLFVPTIEIAKSLLKYKNSILKYNPRSFLELSGNPVNKEIAKTILDVETNEFSLFNNGITMLSSDTEFSSKIGIKYKGQLIITRPQIINGGQTAFTLCRIYEDKLKDGNTEEIFKGKDVLLRVITLPSDSDVINKDKLDLIEAISKATNQQTVVDEADRRANDKIQIEMQDAIFESFGYFYERKRGEYADGIRYKYITKPQIIDREIFIRLCNACDMKPAQARRSTIAFLFREDNFSKTLKSVARHKEYFFAYSVYQQLVLIERKFAKDENNRFGVVNYGNAIRYGKYAVVSAARLLYKDQESLKTVDTLVDRVLNNWLDFERDVSRKDYNQDYFYEYFDTEKQILVRELNFDNYYKGRNINKDVVNFFRTIS